jgi:choice-of-anchor B domain-containing protein
MRSHHVWDKSTLQSSGSVKFNDLWGWVDDDGTEYAILGNVDSIFIIDVTVPDNPVVIDSFYGGSRSLWRDFKTYGDYCYMVADQNTEGLTIIDMSYLPDSVHVIPDTLNFFNRAHNIFIDTTSGKLYALGTDSGAAREGLVILDLTNDPLVPDSLLFVQLDTISTNGAPNSDNYYIHDAYVRNDTVYASHGNLGYFIWDCTDLSDIKLLASYEDDNPGYNHSSWTTPDNQYAIFAAEVPRGVPLYVLELTGLSDTSPPQLDTLSTFKFPLEAPLHLDNTPHNPFVKGDTLIVSYYEDGVQIFDISDINNISRIAYYDTDINNTSYHGTTNNWGVYPFLPSGTIIASDTEFGMFVLQVDESIVPLSWLSVNAELIDGNIVEISWQTFKEFNNEKFVVERSSDGLKYNDLAEVIASGNATEISDYSSIDKNPLSENNYYRIKQIDFGGNSSYSEVVQINLSNYQQSFSVYPNPSFEGDFSIDIQNPGKIYIKIIDAEGKVVYRHFHGDYSGYDSINIAPDISLPSGIYYIQLISNGINSGTKKLIVSGKNK